MSIAARPDQSGEPRREASDSLSAISAPTVQHPGLVVVIPKAGSGVSEHFPHTFRLAEHVQRHVRTAVIVERLVGAEPRADSSIEIHVQRHADHALVRRASELTRLALRLRRRGFRSFFVRTSQTAAVPLILLRRLLGGRVMYWNCGMNPKSRLRDLGIRETLRSEIPLRIALRWADTVVTGTPSLARHYSKTYGIPPERVAVLPNDIDLERFRPPSPEVRREARAELGWAEDEFLILSVHRFSPIRRTSMYVPAVPLAVLERHRDARFVFAGGGPEEAEVRQAVKDARVDDRVQILGAIPHERVWRLYAAADIFMMPSYTEGFPRVLLEAMAVGLPLASTDVGGVREILPPSYHRRLANRERPLELADAIDELLSNSIAAQQLSSDGLGWVRRFDAPLVARRLVQLAWA